MHYYLPLQDFKKKAIFVRDLSFQGEERNNIILSLLLFKILTGNDWINWRKYSEYTDKKTIYEELVPEVDEILFDKEFRKNLTELLNGGKSESNMLLNPPAIWKSLIETRLRCICGGVFKKLNKQEICCDCKKKKIGVVIFKGLLCRPLVVPNTDYRMNMFDACAGDSLLFKIHEREVEGTTERAVFFEADKEVFEIAEGEKKVDQLNSKGNYLRLSLDGKESAAIKIENKVFELKIFPELD